METIAGRVLGPQKPIEPEPTSDKPMNVIKENSAKHLFQEQGGVNISFMGSSGSRICKA